MPWHLSEFLLKGTYLGLLVALVARPHLDGSGPGRGLHGRRALSQPGQRRRAKLREGYRIKGRVVGFTLFLFSTIHAGFLPA